MTTPGQVSCPHCGKLYSITPEQLPQYQGKQIPCSNCGRTFSIGTLGGPLPSATLYAPQVMAARSTSGLAITALILGLISFCAPILFSIPAIICGAIAMGKTRDPRVGGRGLAITGLVLGIVTMMMTPCMISIMLPALNRGREAANRVKCATNLRQLGMAIFEYASNEKNHAFPDSLDSLIKSPSTNLPGDIYVCPASGDNKITGKVTAEELNTPGHLSYIYVGQNQDSQAGLAGAQSVLMYEPVANHKDGSYMLFGDGHVDFVKAPVATKVIGEITSGVNPPPSLNGVH